MLAYCTTFDDLTTYRPSIYNILYIRENRPVIIYVQCTYTYIFIFIFIFSLSTTPFIIYFVDHIHALSYKLLQYILYCLYYIIRDYIILKAFNLDK